MKFLGYLMLFILSFAVTVIWKFPLAGMLPHVNTQPVALAGVSGSVWNGSAQQVSTGNPALLASNVNWRFLPASLVSGNTSATVEFEILGGSGSGDVSRHITSGNLSVTNGTFRVPAVNLGQFLPLPIVDFGGNLIADIESLVLENNLLAETAGTVVWRNATLTGGLEAQLGQVVVDVTPQALDGRSGHVVVLSNNEGDLDINGEVQIELDGNYRADVRLRPTATASEGLAGVLGSLGPIAQRESDGSYRIRQSGNIRSLM